MASNTYTTKQIDGAWFVVQGELQVEKCDGRTAARDRAKVLNAEPPKGGKAEPKADEPTSVDLLDGGGR